MDTNILVYAFDSSDPPRHRSAADLLSRLMDHDRLRLSVVVVSQLYTVDKDDLTERIGALSPARVQQILDGIYLVLEPRDLL